MTPLMKYRSIPQTLEELYTTLQTKAENSKKWNPLPFALHQYIYTFLPIETVEEIPTLCSLSAVEANRNRLVARELIRRSSPQQPLTYEQYLFCKRFGVKREIRHFQLQSTTPKLQIIFDQLPNLSTLKYIYYDYLNPDFEKNKLDALQTLRLDGWAGSRLRKCPEWPLLPNLQSLEYGTEVSIDELTDLLHKCPKLTHLIFEFPSKLSDQKLQAIAPYFGKLTHLDLNCDLITDDGIKAIAPHLGNLTHLRLMDNGWITVEGLTALIPCLKKLTHLYLDKFSSKLTDKQLKIIAPYLGNLTHLGLDWCSGLRNEGLKAAAPYLKNLTHVALPYDYDCGWRYRLDVGLKAVLSHCPNLQEIRIVNERITRKRILEVLSHPDWEKLSADEIMSEPWDGSSTESPSQSPEASGSDVDVSIAKPNHPLWPRIQAAIEHIFQNFG